MMVLQSIQAPAFVGQAIVMQCLAYTVLPLSAHVQTFLSVQTETAALKMLLLVYVGTAPVPLPLDYFVGILVTEAHLASAGMKQVLDSF